MVQVLPANPRKGPGFLQSLLGEVGQNIQPAIEGYLQKREQQELQKQQQQQMMQENEQLKQMGIDLSGINDPKMRQAAFAEAMKGNRKKQEFADIMGQLGQKGQSSNAGSQLRGENTSQQEDEGIDYSAIPDETITAINAINPAAGRDLRHAKDVGLREKTDKAKMEQTENLARRKETLHLRKEYADKAKFAKQAIENKKGSLAILKTGKVDDPFVVEMTKFLPGAVGNRILSPETQIYRAGLFDEFGVLRSFFPGATRVKEIELLEDKLATLDKSHEAKEELLETGIIKSERDIILAKAARQVEKENPNATYLELEEEVQKRAQPELDKLFNKLTSKYEEIYFKHAPKLSNYTDQHGNLYNKVLKEDLPALFNEAKEKGIELKVNK